MTTAALSRHGENRKDFSACHNQAAAGHDHPASVLAADSVNAAEARDHVAGIDFIGAAAAVDQGAAIGDIAQRPILQRRQPADFGLRVDLGVGFRCSRRCRGLLGGRDRTGGFLRGRRCGSSRGRRRRSGGRTQPIDGFAELGDLGCRVGLRTLDGVEGGSALELAVVRGTDERSVVVSFAEDAEGK